MTRRDTENLATPATELAAEVERLRAEISLLRRIVALPLGQTEAEVKALEPGRTTAACQAIDLWNLKSSNEAGARQNRELRAENASLRDVLRKSCDDHIALARQYEAGGNTRGAMQLRAVGNLLGVILQGKTPSTVCPPPAAVQVTDGDGEAD